jgi:peptide/nickel transport system permease protein
MPKRKEGNLLSEPAIKHNAVAEIELETTEFKGTSNKQSSAWKVMKNSKLGMIGLVFLIFMLVVSISAPLIAPYDPVTQNVKERMQPPSEQHWLGTDAYGRDIISRIIYGSQTSLIVGFVSVAVSGLIGTSLGMIAGYRGGLIDEILMRILESIMAIPMLLLGLMLLVALGSNMTTLVIALSIGLIPSCARIARGPTMELKETEFVKAAIATGSNSFKVLLFHILPNIIGPVLVISTLHMASAIRIEASLSFLGLGIQPPAPTWGNMIQDGMRFITTAPWVAIYPGFALMLVVIAFNVFGDTLRDAMDPHIIRQRK